MAKEIIAEAAAELANLDIGAIQRLLEGIGATGESERGIIDKLAKGASEEQLEGLADDLHDIESVDSLAGELAIVGLYRIVEMNTKRVLRLRYSLKKVRKFYQIEALAKKLKDDLNIELANIEGFAAIDELRCVNNAVKHEGTVSKELAKYPSWKKGDRLVGLAAASNRLAPFVPKYLYALAMAVLP
jgi:hypothetical protein